MLVFVAEEKCDIQRQGNSYQDQEVSNQRSPLRSGELHTPQDKCITHFTNRQLGTNLAGFCCRGVSHEVSDFLHFSNGSFAVSWQLQPRAAAKDLDCHLAVPWLLTWRT
jgi:hypothetical protein